MKKLIPSLLLLSTVAFAFDMKGLVDAVDKEKAATSLIVGDKQNVVESVGSQSVTETVDQVKLMKALY